MTSEAFTPWRIVIESSSEV